MYVLVPAEGREPMAGTYSKEVAQGYRETDGESRAAQVVAASLVRGGKDADHQLQGQEELHCHRLPRCCIVVELEGGGSE